jgi:hypothetical protein
VALQDKNNLKKRQEKGRTPLNKKQGGVPPKRKL